MIRGWLGRVEVGDGLPVRVMGIINVSPESFYKDSVKIGYEEIAEAAKSMEKAGADIIDVGAMSTAPYLDTAIPEEEEVRRLRYALEAVKSATKLPISVDTHRLKPAEVAIDLGAEVINDVSGLADHRLAQLVAQHGLSLIVCARRLGKLETAKQAVDRAIAALQSSIGVAEKLGVDPRRIVIDPAIGFHRDTGIEWWRIDLELIRNLPQFRRLGKPILIGVSRKSFIGVITNRNDPRDRLFGSIAAEAVAVYLGVHIVRTHNVEETLDAVKMAQALRDVL